MTTDDDLWGLLNEVLDRDVVQHIIQPMVWMTEVNDKMANCFADIRSCRGRHPYSKWIKQINKHGRYPDLWRDDTGFVPHFPLVSN